MSSFGKRINTPESRARAIAGRIGANPITWLQYQVEKAVDVTPETLAHIRGQFKKLRAKHGPLKSLPDDLAEREYIRIAYRFNAMRIEETILRSKVLSKGFHTASKTLAIYAAAALKFKSNNGKGQERSVQRRKVPSAATTQAEDEGDDRKESDAETA